MDPIGLIFILTVFFIWSKTVLAPKKDEKTDEEKLGEALGNVLKKGINVNLQNK
jgi:hypothetical protein